MEDDSEQSPMSLIASNPSKSKLNTFNFGYDQKLISGTEIGMNFYNSKTFTNSPIQAVNPYFDSEAEVTVTQPLLKGFGIAVTTADLVIAKNDKLKSDQEFIQEVMRIVTEVKQKYYNFQYTEEQYKVAEATLKRVENLHYINKEKYTKGLASNVDILESEAEVARAEEAKLASIAAMKLAEDELKYITNLIDDPAYWNSTIVPLDALSYEKNEPKLVDSIITAFDHRPDYEAGKLDLKNKDISVVYYRNGLLPTVDLFGTYGLNGLSKTYGKDLRHVAGGKYKNWSFGVSVDIPFENEQAKGEYQSSVLEKERAILTFKRLEHQIILEVRNAVRDVMIYYKMLEASLTTMEAETESYGAQETRFRAGLVSTLDILIYQERLARAELNYVKSITDYRMALVKLAKVKGTTLDEDGINVETQGIRKKRLFTES
jgi:outer membrane protein TolC